MIVVAGNCLTDNVRDARRTSGSHIWSSNAFIVAKINVVGSGAKLYPLKNGLKLAHCLVLKVAVAEDDERESPKETFRVLIHV